MAAPRRILIVEDDAEDAALLRRALNGGWVCDVADTLSAALERAAVGGYAAAITDLNLPGVGPESRARIVEQLAAALGPEVPVLALTGALYPGERSQLLAAGARWVGTKGASVGVTVTGEQEAAAYAAASVGRAERRRAAVDGAEAAAYERGLSEGQAAAVGAVAELRGELAQLAPPADVAVPRLTPRRVAAWAPGVLAAAGLLGASLGAAVLAYQSQISGEAPTQTVEVDVDVEQPDTVRAP